MKEQLLEEFAVTVPPRKTGKFRWVICALLFSATLINYMDREILGILKPELDKQFGWAPSDYAVIVNAFQASYAFGQVIFGPILAWLGTKSAFTISIILWSLAAMGTGLPNSVRGFAGAQFVLGLGEGGNFPACIRSVTEWFPQRERSVATGWFNTGSSFGKIVAPLLVPFLFVTIGWRLSFVLLGTAGFVWLLFWLIYYQTPEKSRHVGPAELAHIQTKNPTGEAAEDKIPWLRMLTFRHTWAFVFTGILVGPVWWFYGFWLPDLFNKMFHLNIKQFGLPLATVAIGAVLGSIGGGALSPLFMRRGWSVNAARKTTALICAFSVLPVVLVPSIARAGVGAGQPALWAVWTSTLIFALATAAHQGWSATMYTVVSDIFPKNAVGSVVGLGGSIASVASIAFAWYVGKKLTDTGLYDTILYICGGAYVLALGIFHVIVREIKPVKLK
jgi:ACS family hexuronate transporter-like MFS transporter